MILIVQMSNFTCVYIRFRNNSNHNKIIYRVIREKVTYAKSPRPWKMFGTRFYNLHRSRATQKRFVIALIIVLLLSVLY